MKKFFRDTRVKVKVRRPVQARVTVRPSKPA
jgi:hypothetical protein